MHKQPSYCARQSRSAQTMWRCAQVKASPGAAAGKAHKRVIVRLERGASCMVIYRARAMSQSGSCQISPSVAAPLAHGPCQYACGGTPPCCTAEGPAHACPASSRTPSRALPAGPAEAARLRSSGWLRGQGAAHTMKCATACQTQGLQRACLTARAKSRTFRAPPEHRGTRSTESSDTVTGRV